MRIPIKDMREGRVFFECYAGNNVPYVALEDAYHEGESYQFAAEHIPSGEVQVFRVHETITTYEPALYPYRVYR